MNIRRITKTDLAAFEEFLYLAIFQPQEDKFPREIIYNPDVYIYVKDYGTKDDNGVLAEDCGEIIGMAWTRIIPAYGHTDNETPELAISVLPSRRGQGVGKKLMEELFNLLREKGYKQTSLAVQKENTATKFYERLGYEIIKDKEEEYLMLKKL